MTFDGAADAAYIYLVPIGFGEVATSVPGEEEAGSVVLDFDRNGRLVGVEVLSARMTLPPAVIEQAERIG